MYETTNLRVSRMSAGLAVRPPITGFFSIRWQYTDLPFWQIQSELFIYTDVYQRANGSAYFLERLHARRARVSSDLMKTKLPLTINGLALLPRHIK